MTRSWCIVILTAVCCFVVLGRREVDAQAVSLHGSPQVRCPVASAMCDDGQLLCVVNRRSGSVSLIDADKRQVISEYLIGVQLSDVAVLPDGQTLLITDEARHELLVVCASVEGVEVISRVKTPRSPVDVAVSIDGRLVSVVGLWSHRVALFDVAQDTEVVEPLLTHRATIRLPFAPRQQAFLRVGSHRLVVADAFGGNIAVIDVEQYEIESIRELPGHNLRGLAVTDDGQSLIISHQTLSSLARADYNDVIWGNLMQNVIREMPVESLLKSHEEWLNDSQVIRLGEAGDGAADPAGLALIPNGRGTLIALAGVDEIAVHIRKTSDRIDVGDRPVEIVWDERREVAYVICSLDDTVVIVDPKAGKVLDRISLGPQPAATPRDRGELLFYDGHQSLDGWLSCHSCHPDGHTNHGLADTFGDDSFDTPKKVPSLLGVRDANPWAWNGKFRELHEQVRSSFVSTMRGGGVDAEGVIDVVAFLHTLQPPPPVDTGTWTEDDLAQIQTGRHLFDTLGCRRCHVPPLTFTLDTTFDVGLRDEAGLKKYNPPTLRGVSQRQTYFHDGRAKSLKEVFLTHGHQLDRELTDHELESLLMFLGSL